MKMMYIAGPMTGLPNYNWDRFYEIESMFSNIGIKVFNPARFTDNIGGQKKFIEDAEFRKKVLNEQIRILSEECDSIYLLSGWENSVGAQNELRIAKLNGLKVIIEGIEV